jgi:hypothetical protein
MNKDNFMECLDLKINGNCTKGIDCQICNIKSKENKSYAEDLKLNTNAKHYIPKSKRNLEMDIKKENKSNIQTEEKIKFNLNAEEYIPKFVQNNLIIENSHNEDANESSEEEFDQIMKDIINNEIMEELGEDQESDEEKWYPKYHNCECCIGFVYKCKGLACANLGMCYCKMQEECDYE